MYHYILINILYDNCYMKYLSIVGKYKKVRLRRILYIIESTKWPQDSLHALAGVVISNLPLFLINFKRLYRYIL